MTEIERLRKLQKQVVGFQYQLRSNPEYCAVEGVLYIIDDAIAEAEREQGAMSETRTVYTAEELEREKARADAAEAKLAQAARDVLLLTRARDGYCEERRAAYQEAGGWKMRAEKAEAEIAKLREERDAAREALRPFANLVHEDGVDAPYPEEWWGPWLIAAKQALADTKGGE